MKKNDINHILKSTNYDYYGLRKSKDETEIGDILDPSFLWDDGIQTEDELYGTSAININDFENIENAIKYMELYSGELILVAGNCIEYGEDKHEILINDAIRLL